MSLFSVTQEILNLATLRAPKHLVGRIFVQPGESVAWDDCCDGQLWARVVSVSVNSRNTQGPDPRCRIVSRTARLGLGYIQCVDSMNDEGVAPDPKTMTSEAKEILDMADTLYQVIMCDIPAEYRPQPVSWAGAGPEGGCAGGEWFFDLELPS